MHNILVCDDNAIFLKIFVPLLEKCASMYDVKITAFDNGNDLLEYFFDNECDIIYMDIEIGEDNGMALAKKIKSINPKVLIIYISAYGTYYRDMVQAEPFRFILKEPIVNMSELEWEIADTLAAAMKRIDPQDIWTFEFYRKKYKVALWRIQYFHSVARTIHIVGDTGGAPTYFYGKMDDVQREVEKINSNFVRISKSYIMNMEYAGVHGKEQVKLGSKVFNITKKYRADFEKRMNESRNWHGTI